MRVHIKVQVAMQKNLQQQHHSLLKKPRGELLI